MEPNDHAQALLLSALQGKHVAQADLFFRASNQGGAYLADLMIRVGYAARDWGHALADNSELEFARYMDPAEAAICHNDFAHYLVKEVVSAKGSEPMPLLQAEIEEFMASRDAMNWAGAMVHTLQLCAELVETVLEARNGDAPVSDDDR